MNSLPLPESAAVFAPTSVFSQYITNLLKYYEDNPMLALICRPEDVPDAQRIKASDKNIFWAARLGDKRINAILFGLLQLGDLDTEHFEALFVPVYEPSDDEDAESMQNVIEELYSKLQSVDLQRLVDFVTERQQQDLHEWQASMVEETADSPCAPAVAAPAPAVAAVAGPAPLERCPNMAEFDYCEDHDNGVCPYTH